MGWGVSTTSWVGMYLQSLKIDYVFYVNSKLTQYFYELPHTPLPWTSELPNVNKLDVKKSLKYSAMQCFPKKRQGMFFYRVELRKIE